MSLWAGYLQPARIHKINGYFLNRNSQMLKAVGDQCFDYWTSNLKRPDHGLTVFGQKTPTKG